MIARVLFVLLMSFCLLVISAGAFALTARAISWAAGVIEPDRGVFVLAGFFGAQCGLAISLSIFIAYGEKILPWISKNED